MDDNDTHRRAALVLPAEPALPATAWVKSALVHRRHVASVVSRSQQRIASVQSASVSRRFLRACLVALKLPEGAEPYRPRPPPVWRVSDAVARITALLGRVPESGIPLTAFPPLPDQHCDDLPRQPRTANRCLSD